MSEFDDMRAIITGGSAGLGLTTAELLASRGARVAICGRSEERVASAAARLKSVTDEDRVIARAVDVTDGAALGSLIDEVASTWDGITGLVNGAGVHTGGSFMSTTDQEWQDDFELKLLAAIRGIRLAAPVMEQAGLLHRQRAFKILVDLDAHSALLHRERPWPEQGSLRH